MKAIGFILTATLLTFQPVWALPNIATDTGSLTLPEKFTGKRLDAEIGVYDYGARSYDPVFARFLTPDAAGPRYEDPQTLNPYAYTRNNPVKLVDPTGETFILAALLVYLRDPGTWIDLAFTAMDVRNYFREPTVENLTAVGTDIGFALVPGITVTEAKLGAQTGELAASAASKIRQAAREGELTGEVSRGLSAGQQAVRSSERVAGEVSETVIEKGRRWKVGDPFDAPTARGTEPAWSTQRGRYWKNQAADPGAVGEYGAENVGRMEKGLAPQQRNPKNPRNGGMESRELSHEPVPRREGGRKVEERWPLEHEAVDSYRRTGYYR